MIVVIGFDCTKEITAGEPILAAIKIENRGILPRHPVIEATTIYPNKKSKSKIKAFTIRPMETKTFKIPFEPPAHAGKAKLIVSLRTALVPIFTKKVVVNIL